MITNPSQKKLSRRDAIKLLGAAAGATVLANLPSQWSTPELTSGVLPAHAQTSQCITYTVVVEALGGVSAVDATVIPDERNWNMGEPGNYLRWLCQEGCLELAFWIRDSSPGSIQVTTISHKFTLDINIANPNHFVLIKMATGEYALDFTGSVDGCAWLR